VLIISSTYPATFLVISFALSTQGVLRTEDFYFDALTVRLSCCMSPVFVDSKLIYSQSNIPKNISTIYKIYKYELIFAMRSRILLFNRSFSSAVRTLPSAELIIAACSASPL